MTLLAVNVGRPAEIDYRDRKGRARTVLTGIFKRPVSGPVLLRTLNLEGDGQADLEAHGGEERAVYAYTIENYRFWADALGRDDFDPSGQFGENFTVSGMPEDEIAVGDVFRIGGALVEVTQPRVPCFKLGARMGIADFQKQFAKSLRVGFYLRVLEEGEVRPGDSIAAMRRATPRMTVRALMRLLYFEPDNIADARVALDIAALSPGWRRSFAERVAKAASR
jgi:MOSC domain-containing protein YiiM